MKLKFLLKNKKFTYIYIYIFHLNILIIKYYI